MKVMVMRLSLFSLPALVIQDVPAFCDMQTATAESRVTHVYAIGAVATSVPAVYQLNGTTCQATGLSTQNAVLYNLGAEILTTAFAEGTPGTGS